MQTTKPTIGTLKRQLNDANTKINPLADKDVELNGRIAELEEILAELDRQKERELLFQRSETARLYVLSGDLTVQQITGLYLINADNQTQIRQIYETTVIDLYTEPSKKLNIRAVTATGSTPGNVGSVVFYLTGQESKTETQNNPPYAAFGDGNGLYLPYVFSVGEYQLFAVPFSGLNGTGKVGAGILINITVKDTTPISDDDPDDPTVYSTGVFSRSNSALNTNLAANSANNTKVVTAVTAQKSRASTAFSTALFSVMDKTQIPPSGNKHDAITAAIYWWPNPNTSDGLPYIRKDGQVNPEAGTYLDSKSIPNIASYVYQLGLYYKFKQDAAYSTKAINLLKTFFLNSATKMNPNFNYAEVRWGVQEIGNGVGLVTVDKWTDLVDGMQMILPALTNADLVALRAWFDEFLTWMLTSATGKNGADQLNNVGIVYEAVVVSLALFVGKKQLATDRFINIKARVPQQIAVSGEFERETTRATPWTYCVKALNGWLRVCYQGDAVGVDMWNYTTSDGRSVKKAWLWVVKYAIGKASWPYAQTVTSGENFNYLRQAVRTAQNAWKN